MWNRASALLVTSCGRSSPWIVAVGQHTFDPTGETGRRSAKVQGGLKGPPTKVLGVETNMTTKPHRRRRQGQALVEFALIVPVFLLLLLAAVDFGRIFFTYIQLNNTAREAAAYAAFNPGDGDVQFTTIAKREANVQAQRGETTLSAAATCKNSLGAALLCSSAQGGTGAGNRITVSVTEPFNFFTPLIGNFFSGGLRLGASATAAVVDYAAGGGSSGSTCSTRPPTPTFTWQSPDPVNRPFFISVDAGASASLASPCQNVGYNWDFGGASTDPGSDYLREGVTQDYEYAAGGSYTVTLIVSNAAGDSPPFSRTITLGTTTCQAPTALFTVSPAHFDNKGKSNWQANNNGGNQGTVFTFNGSSSSFMTDPACHPSWSWNYGDGTTFVPPSATATPPTHVYAHSWSGQTPRVTLTVTNDAGTNSTFIDLPLQ